MLSKPLFITEAVTFVVPNFVSSKEIDFQKHFVISILQAILGDVVLCTKEAQFDAKKFADFTGKGDNKKKEAKPKAEPAKKKEPEKKEKKVEEDDNGMRKFRTQSNCVFYFCSWPN